MLSKVSNAPEYSSTYYPTSSSRSTVENYYFNMPKIPVLKGSLLKVKYNSTTSDSSTQTLKIWDGVNVFFNTSFTIGKWEITLPDNVITTKWGNIFKITGTNPNWGSNMKTCIFNNNWYYILSITIMCTFAFTANRKLALPRELKAIWKKASTTLFGMHIDNTRYTGETE